MVQILNKSRDFPTENTVDVGRPTKFGNPFVIGKDGTRAECIKKFRDWIYKNPELIKMIKEELAGKDLMCFCYPKACHAEILCEIANSESISML